MPMEIAAHSLPLLSLPACSAWCLCNSGCCDLRRLKRSFKSLGSLCVGLNVLEWGFQQFKICGFGFFFVIGLSKASNAQVWGGHAEQCRVHCHALSACVKIPFCTCGPSLFPTFVGGKKGVKFGARSRKNSWLLLPQGNARLAPCHAFWTLLFLFAERGQRFKRRRVRGLEEAAAQKAGRLHNKGATELGTGEATSPPVTRWGCMPSRAGERPREQPGAPWSFSPAVLGVQAF